MTSQDPTMQSVSGSKTQPRFPGLYPNLLKLSCSGTTGGRNTFKSYLFFTGEVNGIMRIKDQEERFTSVNTNTNTSLMRE